MISLTNMLRLAAMVAVLKPPRLFGGRGRILCSKPVIRQTGTAGGTAEPRLTDMAQGIAGEKCIPFAQACVEALRSNPQLYVAYLHEHEAAIPRSRCF